MNENIGNLNYQIKIGADFTPFDELERRVDALQAKTNKVTKAAQTGTISRGGKTIEQKREDQVKKRAQAESTREVQRLKKLEAQRVSIIRAAAADRIKIAKAEAAQRARIEAEKQRITGADARRSAQTITKNESASRKQELADLKASILERDKEAKLAQKATDYNDINLQATNRITARKRELAIKQAEINKLVKDQGLSQRAAAERVGVTAAQAKQLGLNMWDAEHAARQFLFTFRRLVGILAIFTLARKFAQALGAAVQEMARFNAEIETAEISIATIVASVGQVRDETGNLVKGAEGFAIALDASRGIINELKKDAIGSIATFEALTKAYQVAIGPGLAAGLDLRQIKEVSNGLAEAAIRMGIPINQLSEEIRSLLQGTATARNTRIAVLFGGAKEANEAIRNAKEQGTLYQLLTESLAGVKEGAKASAQSFAVLQANLQDTFQLLLKEGGIEYFLALKESMLGLAQAVTEVDASGTIIGFSPEALGVVQEISTTLASIIRSFKELTDSASALATVRNLLGTVGSVLKTLAPIASAVFQGVLDGVNTLLAPIRLLLRIFESIAKAFGLDKLNKGLAQAVKFVVQVTVALFLWKKTLLFINGILGAKGILAANKAILTAVLLTAGVLKGQGVSLLSINGLTALWGVLMGDVAVKTALATGGLTLLLGVIAAILVKVGVLDRLINSFNGNIKEGSDQAEALYEQISGAAGALDEGAKSAQDWADELQKAKDAADIAESLKGVEGLSKDILSVIQEETKAYEERNKKLIEERKLKQESVKATKEDAEALKLRDAIIQNATSLDDLYAELPDVTDADIQKFLERFQAKSVFNPLSVPVQFSIDEAATTEVLIKTKEIEGIEKALAEEADKTNQLIKERIRLLVAEQGLRVDQTAVNIAKNNRDITESLNARANVSARNLAVAQAELAILASEKKLVEDTKIATLARYDAEILKLKEIEAQRALTLAESAVLQTFEDEKSRAQDEFASKSAVITAEYEAQTAEVQKQTDLLSGDFGASLREGLAQFSRELPALGEQMADIISGALTDLAGVVASTFKDAIDPRKDADLRTAFGEFFLDLAGSFVETLTASLIQKGIDVLLNTAADKALPSAGELAIATTITTTTAAQTVALTTAMGIQTSAIVAALGTVAATNAIPLAKGGLVKGFADGGKIKGYASGGDINTLPRPSSIPASDTVPAWLTPGEFVIKKDSVRKYGAGLLNAINNGVLNPRSFTATGMALGGMARGVQHFATGGGVRQASVKGRGASQPQQIVLPILPTTNNNMEQIIAGGRSSFTSNVNKVDYIGDPNKSSSWK